MKLTLKLSAKQLSTLIYCFQNSGQTQVQTKEEKFTWSILNEIILKVQKKYLDVTASTNLFNSKKKHSFNFTYYQAFMLEKFLQIAQQRALSEYDRNVVQLIISTINKQLV
jgi:hypothetical protein